MYKFCIVIVVLFCATANASQVFTRLDTFCAGVRQEIGIESTVLVPDTTLQMFAKSEIIWVSSNVGGLEFEYRFYMLSDTPFYVLPDTISRILTAKIITTGGATHSLKSYYPQFFQELTNLTSLGIEGGEDDLPQGYYFWNDSIQMMPIPVSDSDRVILTGYLEHSAYLDSTANDWPIGLEQSYIDLAFMRTCMRVFRSLKMYDDAAVYKEYYKEMEADVRATQQRQFDILQRSP